MLCVLSCANIITFILNNLLFHLRCHLIYGDTCLQKQRNKHIISVLYTLLQSYVLCLMCFLMRLQIYLIKLWLFALPLSITVFHSLYKKFWHLINYSLFQRNTLFSWNKTILFLLIIKPFLLCRISLH